MCILFGRKGRNDKPIRNKDGTKSEQKRPPKKLLELLLRRKSRNDKPLKNKDGTKPEQKKPRKTTAERCVNIDEFAPDIFSEEARAYESWGT